MPEPQVREVTRDELVAKRQRGEPFILVDVLSHEHFIKAHLPGAINVPANRLRELAPLLFGRDDQIVVYCASFSCHASPASAKVLMQLGFTDVLDFAGGIQDWESGGLPMVRSQEGEQPPQQQAA